MMMARYEARALQALDVVRRKSNPEDGGVELKLKMPEDVRKVARQIAAMANAARGEPFIWMIGVDEKTGEITPPTLQLHSWWDQVKSHFDGDAPNLRDSHLEGALILVFEPEHAPYVVRTSQEDGEKGLPEFEVPWREGTRTRSARRSDLLRILVPTLRTPDVDVHSGEFEIRRANTQTGYTAHVAVKLFVVPRTSDLVTLPSRNCRLAVLSNEGTPLFEPRTLYFAGEAGSMVEAQHPSQAYCKGPGSVNLTGAGDAEATVIGHEESVVVEGQAAPIPAGPPLQFSLRLRRLESKSSERARWDAS